MSGPARQNEAIDLVRRILVELQDAVRAKDRDRTLELFTQDAALLGTGAVSFGREAVSGYLELVFGQRGFVRWVWDTVSVLDVRPGAVTFAALGTVSLEGDPDSAAEDPIRLTCLAVEEDGHWRLRVFHGSVPAA
ncbi:SgcJ/EcaC family oxidoreductase [Nocardioides panacis]|uniref:SgcJ/EcaC family oxidoreductase n=1 Tax=Nocardioides panacis TaxID=2849501 RepID=A0A975T2S4_9ACTN|nr:SgcJ/EcaC family oxidoreductase [Nocardioides panacis]QWZ09813.1 SgcJ/EcaC family oxidoreductase [Nocardioides panacis]